MGQQSNEERLDQDNPPMDPEEKGFKTVSGIAHNIADDLRLRVVREGERLVLTMNGVQIGDPTQSATPQTLRAVIAGAVNTQVQAHLEDPYEIACMALVGRGQGGGPGRTTLFEVLGENGLNTKESGANLVLAIVEAAIVGRAWDFATTDLRANEKSRRGQGQGGGRSGGRRNNPPPQGQRQGSGNPPPALKPAAKADGTKGGDSPPNGVKAVPIAEA